MRVEPGAALVGDIAVPGVKGICQRGVLLGAVADGESEAARAAQLLEAQGYGVSVSPVLE